MESRINYVSFYEKKIPKNICEIFLKSLWSFYLTRPVLPHITVLKFFDADPGSGMEKFRSGMKKCRIWDPQHCNKVYCSCKTATLSEGKSLTRIQTNMDPHWFGLLHLPPLRFRIRPHWNTGNIQFSVAQASVGDPWHFSADPDPRICTSDFWIQIQLWNRLLSSVT